jgi:hypothetical protein
MFGERPLVDYIKNTDPFFAVGLWVCLECYRKLVTHSVRFHTLSRNSNVMVRTRLVWALLIMFVEKTWIDLIKKVDASFAVGLGAWLGSNTESDPHFPRFYTLP